MKIRGTNSGDALTGTEERDDILGLLGDDVLEGLAGDDRIDGGGGDDRLSGGDGIDYLEGGAGADRLDGGEGRDVAVYLASTAVRIDLNAAAQSGGEAEGDVLVGVENVVGSAFDDVIVGDGRDNTLRGAAGADTIDGGSGLHDRASYATSAAAVDADLGRAGPQIGGDAAGDVLAGIDDLTGSEFADRLVGSAADNAIAGSGGGDLIDGGAGIDTAEYGGSTAVDVDLARYGQQAGGDAAGDVLLNIENLSGSAYGDRLAGDAAANHLSGRGGDDLVIGAGGRDTLHGGEGDDTVVARIGSLADGGSGGDILVIDLSGLSEPTDVGFDVEQLEDGTIQVTDRHLPDYVAATGMRGVGFERIEVIGSAGDDRLFSAAGDDTLRGGAGEDTILGWPGADVLDGGSGVDTLLIGYAGEADPVLVDMIAGTATGHGSATSFERLQMSGGEGDDTVYAAKFYNFLSMRGGDDLVVTTTGVNTIDAGWGTDTVIGGSGDDAVTVREAGEFDGGGGTNRLTLAYWSDEPTSVEVAPGDDFAGTTSTGASFRNFSSILIQGSDGSDLYRLGGEADTVDGHGGDDVIAGGEGDDSLSGDNGDDSISGDGGDDVVSGGVGSNEVSGGGGADRFVFVGGNDTIVDFDAGEGDVLVIPRNFHQYAGMPGTFEEAVDRAIETDGGLLIESDNGSSGVLIAGVTLGELTADAFDFTG
jgi:Ca2+-binding RTX toxin-like protein